MARRYCLLSGIFPQLPNEPSPDGRLSLVFLGRIYAFEAEMVTLRAGFVTAALDFAQPTPITSSVDPAAHCYGRW